MKENRPLLNQIYNILAELQAQNKKITQLHIGHTRLMHEHLMMRHDWQTICTNAACGNQTLTIKHYLVECPQ